MPSFATTSAIQLWPFTDYLLDKDISAHEYLAKHQLPISALDQPDIKLSTQLVYRCISDIARNEKIENLGWLVGLRSGAMALGPLSRLALAADTLGGGLNGIIQATSLHASHADFFINKQGGFTYFCHVGGVGVSTPGYCHVESYLVAFLVMLVRQAAGQGFYPERVLLRSEEAVELPIEIKQVIRGSGYTAISIPTHLLDKPFLPMKDDTQEFSGDNPIDLSRSKEKYPEISTLIDILSAYLQEKIPNIATIAIMGSISVRGLQRKLTSLQLTYTKLIQLLKIELAEQLLQQEELSVSDVSKRLNYEHASHFIRAFKKQMGLTPKQFQLRRS